MFSISPSYPIISIYKNENTEKNNPASQKRKREDLVFCDPCLHRPTPEDFDNFQTVQHVRLILSSKEMKNFKDYLYAVKNRSNGRELNAFINRIEHISSIAKNILSESPVQKNRKEASNLAESVERALKFLSPVEQSWISNLNGYFKQNEDKLNSFINDMNEIKVAANSVKLSNKNQKNTKFKF